MSKQSKLCPYCKETIKHDAVYCVNCNNFLNWRKFLTFGTTFLALLVAVVSVLSFCLPIIKQSLTPNNSELNLNYSFVSGDQLNMVVSNSGNKPGMIVNGSIDCEVLGKKLRIDLDVDGAGAGDNFIIPGAFKQMTFHTFDTSFINLPISEIHPKALLINCVDFKGNRITLSYTSIQKDLSEFLKAKYNK